MSQRNPNNLQKFFPDRNKHPDDLDRSNNTPRSPFYRRDRYYPSHKELYVPSSKYSKDRERPHNSSYDRPYTGRYSRKYDEASSYTPQKKTAETTEKSTSTTNLNSTPKSERSDAPTETTTASSSPPKEDQPALATSSEPTIAPEPVSTPLSQPVGITWNTRINPNILVDCQSFKDGQLRPNTEDSRKAKESFRVIYDPELSKDKSKGNSLIIKKTTEPKPSKDPRTQSNFKSQLQSMKRHSKVPYKSLPLTKFSYDKQSVGPPPPNEIVISGLGTSTSDVYLINQLKSIGSIEETEIILDPLTGVPLGMLRVKFGDSHDKAFKACKTSIKSLNQTKVNGSTITIILKRNEEVYHQAINKEIGSKITKIKLAEIEEKKTILPSAPKSILNAISRQHALREAKVNKFAARAEARAAALAAIKAKEEGSKRLVDGDNRLLSIPETLSKYIKNRSFIFIDSKYTKNKLSKNDVKKALETYDWSRVLDDDLGIFIVFNSPREAKRCFHLEDGKTVFSVNLYMKLQLPDGYQSTKEDNDYTLQERDVLDETTSLLTKELENALQKDIRSKVIAPAILQFLNIDNFPDLKPKILPTIPAIDKKPLKEPKEFSVEPESKEEDSSIDVFSLQKKLPKLPTFRKKDITSDRAIGKITSPKKRKLLPMNYKLNFQDDYDSEIDSNISTPQPEELEGPVKKKAKTLVDHKSDNEDEEMEDTKTGKELVYSSSSEDEEEPIIETKESIPTTPEEDKMDIDGGAEEISQTQEEIDHSIFDRLHQPVTSEIPIPVYDEDEDDLLLDIEGFQQLIKDDEDFELLKEILKEEVQTQKPLDLSPGYWAWKSRDLKAERKSGVEKSTIIIPSELESTTGSYRSQGYSKIPDEVKVDYLPHRKRVHDPLNTIQVDNEEPESSKVQSSRANRSNNRRFANEVSNFNTENELLTMNQLNKRKKPVSFARSAIHNWGLYALEPIAGREMIIEYVGERIRQQVADFREKAYLKSGIGSSYLFRVDENTVIDATKKGGIARFINHSCVPSCTAKIIKVEGQKRIVIYALRDIGANEELTYDYKFERETNDNERVRCLCGAPGCKGYLN